MKRNIMKYILLCLILVPAISVAEIGLSIPDTSGFRGDYIDIPIKADSSFTGHNVTSYYLQISYSESYLRLEDVIDTGTLTASLGHFEYNKTGTGIVTIAAAGDSPLEGKGLLIKLRFYMRRSGGVNISFYSSGEHYLNEGEPELILENGRLTIENPPSINISPDERLMTVSEQHQFTVSGGTAPYTWSVTNPGVASISSSGLLTALNHGFTQVVVEDNNGIIDTTTGQIEIRAFKIWTRDTSLYQGQIIGIPLYVSDMSGLDVTSGVVRFTSFTANLLEAIDVTTSGTLLESYVTPEFKTTPGKLELAFAGTTPLAGSGILCIVHFQATRQTYGTTTLRLEEPLFNETLIGNIQNGSCRVNRLPTLSVTPSTANLLVGDTLRFAAGGGTDPYTWSTSNPAAASIDDTGLLNALDSDIITVIVEDDLGSTGSSGNINIYDTKITIPDTSAHKNTVFDCPVYMEELPAGKELLSIQTSISIDTTVLSDIDIVTTGSLTEGWSFATNYTEGSFHLAGAGTSPVTDGGILFYLRFYVRTETAVGYRTYLNFQELLLNEGSPTALPENGSLTTLTTGFEDRPGDRITHSSQLFQNYPNPFNPKTVIEYRVETHHAASVQVELSIYNSLGQKVATLVSEKQRAGMYKVDWNADGFSSGLYYYRLIVDNQVLVRTMLLIR